MSAAGSGVFSLRRRWPCGLRTARNAHALLVLCARGSVVLARRHGLGRQELPSPSGSAPPLSRRPSAATWPAPEAPAASLSRGRQVPARRVPFPAAESDLTPTDALLDARRPAAALQPPSPSRPAPLLVGVLPTSAAVACARPPSACARNAGVGSSSRDLSGSWQLVAFLRVLGHADTCSHA